jgi:predicted transcriptional regulator
LLSRRSSFVYIRVMATFLSSFHDALAEQAEAALIAVVASRSDVTVAELAELLRAYPTLGTTTLTTMLGSGGGSAPKRKGRPPGRKSATTAATTAAPGARKPKAGGGRKPNVRTGAGREQFDQDLLAALTDAGGDSINAATLRGAVGGDPNQVRTALNRLIERGLVTFSGKARGTRYSLAQGRPQVRRAGGPGQSGASS